VLKVKVLEVDLQRKRIALTMKLEERPVQAAPESFNRDRQPQPAPRTPARDHKGARDDSRGRSAPTRDNRGGGPGRDFRGGSGGPGGGGGNRHGGGGHGGGFGGGNRGNSRPSAPPRESQGNGAMAEAWAAALKKG